MLLSVLQMDFFTVSYPRILQMAGVCSCIATFHRTSKKFILTRLWILRTSLQVEYQQFLLAILPEFSASHFS